MPRMRADHVAGYRILLGNLLGKVWKVRLGIIKERSQAAAELQFPRWSDRSGINIDQWKALNWITKGQATKAKALRDALVNFLDGDTPIDEQHLWPVVTETLNHEIGFDQFEQALIAIETKYGRSTRTNHATHAYFEMVGMEAHEEN